MSRIERVRQSRVADAHQRRTAKENNGATADYAALRAGLVSPATAQALQRRTGNRAVGRIIQAKLTVGPADDPYEREAERVAAQIAPAPQADYPDDDVQLSRQASAAADAPVVGPEGGEAGAEIEQELASSQGGGMSLPPATRAQMEAHLGADFSGVRVHTGAQADRLNRQLGAQAFTWGSDIYMADGKYNPSSRDGQRLLAHELTHVVQQAGGAARSARRQSPPVTCHPPAVQRFPFKHLFRRRPKIARGSGRKMETAEMGNVPSAGDIASFYEASRRRQEIEGPGFWIEDQEQMAQALQSQREQETLTTLSQAGYHTDLTPPPYTGPRLPANVPLTGADLKAARRMIYDAALQTLDETPQEADRQEAIRSLRNNLTRERNADLIHDEESLLPKIAAGDKASLQRVISKDLLDRLAARIAEATGQDTRAVEERAHVKLARLINASPRWAPFAKKLDLGGQTYTSQFTPINQAFDPTFAGYGASGYASMTAHLPVSEQAPLEQRTRATNAWYTQFRRGDSITGDILFEAFRSGSFSEKGIKDPEQRREYAQRKAYDLLKAMAVQYLKSREPADQQAILAGTQTPTITVVSTALLTSLFGKLDHKLLQAHAEAFESFHGRKTAFDITFGGQQRSIVVKFNIINFNKAVNEFRWFGASRSRQQLAMNRTAIERLRAFMEEGLHLLEAKQANNATMIALGGENADALRQQNEALTVRIAKIRQLWARIERVTARRSGLFSGSGSGYELPALVSNLAYQLGATVHYNCMSGKDRTGMADVEAKLLAYQMDQRVKYAQETGRSLDQVNLVPRYSGRFSPDDAEAIVKLMFESGNLDIQQINTGVAGYKVRGAMAGLVSGGRVGKVLSTDRGQTTLRQYLGVNDQISLKAKTFTKAINALSIFTGA